MQVYIARMTQEWTDLIDSTPPHILIFAAELAQCHAVSLSESFYQQALLIPEARAFLTNKQAENQLKKSLEDWIKKVLSCTCATTEERIAIQQHASEICTRTGVPVHLIETGGRILKKLLFPLIVRSPRPAEEQTELTQFIVCSIDLALEVMSRVSSFNESSASRENENYRISSLIENAEEEKARQAASLMSWERDVINKLMLDVDPVAISPASKGEFGLWFNHKGRHYFSGRPETEHVARLLLALDKLLLRTEITAGTSYEALTQRTRFLILCQSLVSRINLLMKTLFDDVSRHETGVDILTRLLNRRFLATIFRREIAHANRSGQPLSVLLIDVDRFKQINDTYGHNAGDDVLRKVSQIFYNNVRSSDYVFRYGGDEFLIVLAEASEQETFLIAERIRHLVSQQVFTTSDGISVAVTLSVGAAMYDGHPDYEHLTQEADIALYQAKSRGRNRVEMSDPEKA